MATQERGFATALGPAVSGTPGIKVDTHASPLYTQAGVSSLELLTASMPFSNGRMTFLTIKNKGDRRRAPAAPKTSEGREWN